ncbi:hypothetical protein PAMP_006361 [Pampus punctatissimus]
MPDCTSPNLSSTVTVRVQMDAPRTAVPSTTLTCPPPTPAPPHSTSTHAERCRSTDGLWVTESSVC